ncbi:unnamed protein product [Paramecium sonneborni]|uniref:Uncharacterized protein n=1 Tax=Paramecium sonneborni TaxID=65129 RepID=A0A8S1RS42_9CILI|nr:unnamed protein product [Paramecium sonneborni]
MLQIVHLILTIQIVKIVIHKEKIEKLKNQMFINFQSKITHLIN